MCAREGMVIPVFVLERVQNVKNCTKLAGFSVLCANNWTSKALFGTFFCASKGMDFSPSFVPPRVGSWTICATEGRGFAVPS